MGLLGQLTRGVLRGADRQAPWTSKRGPNTFYKSRGCKNTGFNTYNRFIKVPEMVPKLVVPDLTGFKLRPYVSYRAPAGSEPPPTARDLFQETVAPSIKKDLQEGTFDAEKLEKYGFEPTQEGKLFQLFPKNFVR